MSVCYDYKWSFDYVFKELPLSILEECAIYALEREKDRLKKEVLVVHTTKPKELFDTLSEEKKVKKEPSIKELVAKFKSCGIPLVEVPKCQK